MDNRRFVDKLMAKTSCRTRYLAKSTCPAALLVACAATEPLAYHGDVVRSFPSFLGVFDGFDADEAHYHDVVTLMLAERADVFPCQSPRGAETYTDGLLDLLARQQLLTVRQGCPPVCYDRKHDQIALPL